MRIFFKRFAVLLVIGSTIGTLLSAAIVWAAGATTPGVTVIGEETLFTMKAMVFIGTNIAGWAATIAICRSHMENPDIHLRENNLNQLFRRTAECELIHKDLDDPEHQP